MTLLISTLRRHHTAVLYCSAVPLRPAPGMHSVRRLRRHSRTAGRGYQRPTLECGEANSRLEARRLRGTDGGVPLKQVQHRDAAGETTPALRSPDLAGTARLRRGPARTRRAGAVETCSASGSTALQAVKRCRRQTDTHGHPAGGRSTSVEPPDAKTARRTHRE